MTDTSDTTPEKMPLTSMDIAEEKRELLKKCLAAAFPEAMAEDKIDFDQLKRVLGEWVEPDRERFGLNWPGKAACMKVIQAPSVGTLKPCPEESVDWDTTENLFIEGDNLEVLKLLQKAYFGKVKMIYIDPPYNTGSDFIYPDKYSETLDTYLQYTGQKDSEGRKFSTNTDSSGRFHSAWLNMMYPRIYLAKNLLRDDGVIFVSIDDNEGANLRLIMDQIFGGENFIANICWKHTQQSKNDERYFSRHYNSIVVYRKTEAVGKMRLPRTDEDNQNYSNPDNDPKGPWRSGDVRSPNYRSTLRYEIISPSGKKIQPPDNGWRWSSESVKSKISTGEIVFSKDEEKIIRKIYLADQEGRTPENVWSGERYGTTRSANNHLKEIFDGRALFDTVKPVELIQVMLDLFHNENDFIIVDFFAGSASTADAVYRANAKDGGTRKWIMVQLPEQIEDGSEAKKAGYSNIAKLARERIKRSSEAMAKAHSKMNIDLGFRAFALNRSCFKTWDGEVDNLDDRDLIDRISSHAQHIDPSAKPEEILFELLLKDGFPLTVALQRFEVAGKEVFSIAEGALLICLDRDLTQELMDALAEMEPARVICLDAGFKGNDQLKANAVQTFKARARTKETAIEFRTV